MPMYSFETDAGAAGPHETAVELPDVRAAQIAAVRHLGELLEDDGAAFWKEEVVTLTALDETRLPLFRLELSVALAGRALPLHAESKQPGSNGGQEATSPPA
jgi:hypothetical protein